MSGHSKWSTIKRKKGANDSVRGKIFSKLSKEIMIAVREGGKDPIANTRLRAVLIKAQSSNMPHSNIDRAIKKASGEMDSIVYEELSYEGYALGGVAVFVQCLTDNKNRTGPAVRHVFSKYGGNLGEHGCVSYMFTRKGIILLPSDSYKEETVFEVALEGGAYDMQIHDDEYEIITSPEHFSTVVHLLQEAQYQINHAEITLIPDSYISLSPEDTNTTMTLIEQMEDLDDVQSVSHNLEISH